MHLLVSDNLENLDEILKYYDDLTNGNHNGGEQIKKNSSAIHTANKANIVTLINNQIDIAVHSAKDIPPIIHDITKLSAFTERLDARDCLLSPQHSSLKKLPKNAIIGTSSTRRKAFILKQRPDIQVVNLRGNIDTRLNKISENNLDGAILAVSGLLRLGKENSIKEAIKDSSHFYITRR